MSEDGKDKQAGSAKAPARPKQRKASSQRKAGPEPETGPRSDSGPPAGGEAREAAVAKGADEIYAFADELREAAADAADVPTEESRSWVSFHVEDSVYALPVEDVQEVLRVGPITRVPHSPNSVRGVTNLRGRVLPVIDLSVRLGRTPTELGDKSRILVARYQGRPVGLLVDVLEHMAQILPSAVRELPGSMRAEEAECLSGVCDLDGQLIALLDVQTLLTLDAGVAARA